MKMYIKKYYSTVYTMGNFNSNLSHTETYNTIKRIIDENEKNTVKYNELLEKMNVLTLENTDLRKENTKSVSRMLDLIKMVPCVDGKTVSQ